MNDKIFSIEKKLFQLSKKKKKNGAHTLSYYVLTQASCCLYFKPSVEAGLHTSALEFCEIIFSWDNVLFALLNNQSQRIIVFTISLSNKSQNYNIDLSGMINFLRVGYKKKVLYSIRRIQEFRKKGLIYAIS